MSEILDAQCSVAALRVFETPELLELILVQVAEWEVDLESQCTSKTTDPKLEFTDLPAARSAISPSRTTLSRPSSSVASTAHSETPLIAPQNFANCR